MYMYVQYDTSIHMDQLITDLLVDNEHGYIGAIFAGIEDLLGGVLRRIKTFNFNFTKHLKQTFYWFGVISTMFRVTIDFWGE